MLGILFRIKSKNRPKRPICGFREKKNPKLILFTKNRKKYFGKMRIAPISESVNILPYKERSLSENERFDVSEATGVGGKRGSFRTYRKPDVRKAEGMSEKMDEAGSGRWGSKGFQKFIRENYIVLRIEWGYDLIRFFKAGK